MECFRSLVLGGRKFRSRWVPGIGVLSPVTAEERVSCVHVLFDFVKSLVSSRACKAPKELWKKKVFFFFKGLEMVFSESFYGFCFPRFF